MFEYNNALETLQLKEGYTFIQLLTNWRRLLKNAESVCGMQAIMMTQEYNAAFVILKSHLDCVECAA